MSTLGAIPYTLYRLPSCQHSSEAFCLRAGISELPYQLASAALAALAALCQALECTHVHITLHILKMVTAAQVTETDQKCESTIISTIKRKYPEHAFIGEETSAEQGSVDSLTDTPTWIIDPLDGTTNFVHKFPFVCVCIGLAIDKKVCSASKSPHSDTVHCVLCGADCVLNPTHCRVRPLATETRNRSVVS